MNYLAKSPDAHKAVECVDPGEHPGFDGVAFASSIAGLLDAPIPAAVPRSGPAAAYLCTRGLADLRDVIRPLSYRFDKVFVLSTEEIDVGRWSNAVALDWRGETVSFYNGLETTRMATACGIPSDWDLPAKRTVALQHAREHSYGVGLLIDDDIKFMGTGDLDQFRLMQNALAGRSPRSSPDLSVVEEMVCAHTYPHAFPNGNYLFFDPSSPVGFFPKIYNDDWLFIWSSRDCKPTIMASGSLTHGARSFDREQRAASQEFGETLIKGLFSPQPIPVDESFWHSVIDERCSYLRSLHRLSTVLTSRRIVEVALAMHDKFDGATFVRWCQAFFDDNRRWREKLEERVR